MKRPLSLFLLMTSLGLFAGEIPMHKDCVNCIPEPAGTLTSKNMPILNTVAKITDQATRGPANQPSLEEQFIAKINRGLCRIFSENDFSGVQKVLKNASRRFLGREMKMEEAYQYIRCDQAFASNIDLIRITAEKPIGARHAAQNLVDYFVEKAQDKSLLGKIVSCKKDFGYGCLNVFDHIEKNLRESQGNTARVEDLNDFKQLLHNNLSEADIKYDREFCQQFLDEPPHCQ